MPRYKHVAEIQLKLVLNINQSFYNYKSFGRVDSEEPPEISIAHGGHAIICVSTRKPYGLYINHINTNFYLKI